MRPAMFLVKRWAGRAAGPGAVFKTRTFSDRRL